MNTYTVVDDDSPHLQILTYDTLREDQLIKVMRRGELVDARVLGAFPGDGPDTRQLYSIELVNDAK